LGLINQLIARGPYIVTVLKKSPLKIHGLRPALPSRRWTGRFSSTTPLDAAFPKARGDEWSKVKDAKVQVSSLQIHFLVDYFGGYANT